MKRFLSAAALALVALAAQSCLIDNDMSYPRIYANVTAFAVEGQESCSINTDTRTVSVVLGETAYLDRVTVTQRALSPETRIDDFPQVGDVLDLTQPRTYTLTTYQDYEWTVSATQPISRYITCGNQGSAPILNPDIHEALVYVVNSQSLQNVTINSMKLERTGSSIYMVTVADDGSETVSQTPCTFPMTVDAQTQLQFDVRYDDVTVRWKVTFVQEALDLSVTEVIPWTYHFDVEAVYDRSGTPFFQYRQTGASEWIDFRDVTVNGINISASIPGGDTSLAGSVRLEPGTSYEVRVCTEDSQSSAETFRTGTPDQIYNMGFEDWYTTTSGSFDIWYPNLNDTYKVWGTANPGSGAFIGSLTTRTESVREGTSGSYAARLESKNALIAFAAGNIYTGEFGRVSGLGAILDWGTPFTGRPCALKGYYAYKPVLINYASSAYADLRNQMDQCQLLVILTDWTQPFTVNTTEGIFVDQSRNNTSIIAYGKIESSVNTFELPEADANGYIPFTVELEYWRPDATPTYAVVIACASYKGDYFTGGEGSLMFVDDFEFVYN